MKFFLAFALLVFAMILLPPGPAMILFLVAMPLLALWFWRDSMPKHGEALRGGDATERQDTVGRLRASIFQFLK